MSRLHGNAMVNDDGAVFQPATVEDALRIEAEHGAHIAAPDRWPWPCPVVSTWNQVPPREAFLAENLTVEYSAITAHTQCRRVAGHGGEHRAEVAW